MATRPEEIEGEAPQHTGSFDLSSLAALWRGRLIGCSQVIIGVDRTHAKDTWLEQVSKLRSCVAIPVRFEFRPVVMQSPTVLSDPSNPIANSQIETPIEQNVT